MSKLKNKNRLKENKRNERGITLIALVITIIVLLILAGVSIATLTGENGILTRASDASEQTKKGSAEEQVNLAVAGSIGENGSIYNDDLKTNLDRIDNISGVPSVITDDSYPLTVTVDGYSITIYKDGVIVTTISLEQAKDESMLNKTENSTIKLADGVVKLPAGFKVSEDSAEEIKDGIVIEDSNKNQFVWIPVTESTYIRNTTYAGEGISQNAFTDNEYLPDVIQPDLNGETDDKKIGTINEEAERQAVIRSGGFYIARFETGEEGTETLVSKKGANVQGNISQEEAKVIAKKMINTTHVKTALCSGIQWDVVMEFVNGKLDGATPAQTFDVRTPSNSRHIGNDVPAVTGENEADRVCNIYDLEGNCMEWIAEKADNLAPVLRGGGTSVFFYEASSRAQTVNNQTFPGASFRVVLYVI